jgi:mannonate dehydratase
VARIGRRAFLRGLAPAAAVLAGPARADALSRDDLINPCRGPLPEPLARHELLQAAFEGLDPADVWDCHAHLAGTGDSGEGTWMSPRMQSLLHPIEYARRLVMLNAACVDSRAGDRTYVERLHALTAALPPGAKAVLLAFDYHHDAEGRVVLEHSPFRVSNAYAAAVARRHPDRFEWIASIHPHREDAADAMAAAVREGARAVKWLPNAMGIDPASPRCDRFYDALVRAGLPLLSHAGDEAAVHGRREQELGNPLRLRRPLERGVRVIVAHCAALGSGVDLDRGPAGPRRPNFELFARLMDEPRYAELLRGDLSAVTQVNRVHGGLARMLTREDWHPRLLFGTDYPLPGVMPLSSTAQLVRARLLAPAEAPVLDEIRGHNPLLFDFVLKRRLRASGTGFAADVFRTRRQLAPAPGAQPPPPR